MPATFQGSSFLLTYPQSNFDLNEFLNHLTTQLGVSYARVSSEQHADGSLHRHALIHFPKKIRQGTRYFDYATRHPNVKTVGRRKEDWSRCLAYVTKDGDFLEFGTPRHNENSSIWSQIVNASSREEAQEILIKEKPREAVLNARNFDYFLDKVCVLLTFTSKRLSLTVYIDVPSANVYTIHWTPR